ncbi:MAG: glutamate-5-semialdehyde dehydrogenase [Lachnospiraceae bacterium]|nr:glutamate-5-semialdehyde dehydrogenase [Lachnospiraceae bacterium]
MSITSDVTKMKQISPYVAALSCEKRNAALLAIADALEKAADEIFAENKKDLDLAEENGVAPAVKKRLKFDEGKLSDVTKGLRGLAQLEDPIGKVTLHRELDSDLELTRITCPIGVIGVIFEARPDAMIQIASLCIKSGNCAVLKGGKETANSNRYIFDIINKTAIENGFPEGGLCLAETHSQIDELLTCDRYVDLIIPRGSNAFVRHIMDNTKIPVMGHADGICHIYVDKSADQEMAVRIIKDAKMQYTAACNAVETLLVNQEIADTFIPLLYNELKAEGITLRGTGRVKEILDSAKDKLSYDTEGFEVINTDEFPEYLSLTASVAVVDGVDQAIEHINRYGSHHTDSIITMDDEAAERFMQLVDSAGVYRNCSTRFSDGFRYGFGAEVGISTGKIHARGPVGLEGLVTYKYKLIGNGQTVGDYASGKRTFNFKDI